MLHAFDRSIGFGSLAKPRSINMPTMHKSLKYNAQQAQTYSVIYGFVGQDAYFEAYFCYNHIPIPLRDSRSRKKTGFGEWSSFEDIPGSTSRRLSRFLDVAIDGSSTRFIPSAEYRPQGAGFPSSMSSFLLWARCYILHSSLVLYLFLSSH